MARCPECAELMVADAMVCPACGHDRHVRRLVEAAIERDEELEADQLLAAAIANSTHAPPPPWVAPLSDRMAPRPGDRSADGELGDVMPRDVVVRRRRIAFWKQ